MSFDINTHYTAFQVNFNDFIGASATFLLVHTVYIKIRSKQFRGLLRTTNSNPLNTNTTGNFTSHQELRKKIRLLFHVILINDQLDALFSMYLFHASTCFEQQVLIITRIKLCQYVIWYNTL